MLNLNDIKQRKSANSQILEAEISGICTFHLPSSQSYDIMDGFINSTLPVGVNELVKSTATHSISGVA